MAKEQNIQGVFVSPTRQVRVQFGREIVASSKDVMLLRESPIELHYFFPKEHVKMELLEKSDHTTHSGYKGDAIYWHVKVGDRVAENAAWTYESAPEGRPDVSDYIAFDWDKMDAWFEEAEQVFGHPRDPFHRIDIIASTRHVKVEVDGVSVADSVRPYVLFETGLPARYYIPAEDVETQYLTPTDSTSRCPYKGLASYWSVQTNGEIHEDIVWAYPEALPESHRLPGTLCFYNEKVDIYVDGELEERPQTPWS